MTQADARLGTRRRAPRYAIEAPVRFWHCGGEAREGMSVNVGRLGLLFRTPETDAPAVTSVIQFRMALSPGHGWGGAYVACTGRVVRALRSPHPGEMLVATTIDESALRPADCHEAPPVGSQYAEASALLRVLADQDGDAEATSESLAANRS